MWFPGDGRPSLKVKPGRPPKINRAHPLSGNIVLCVVPPWGELITKTKALFEGTTPSSAWIASAGLVEGSTASATGDARVRYILPANSPLWSLPAQHALFVLGNGWDLSTKGAYATLLSIPYRNGSWTFPYGAIGVQRNASTTSLNYHVAQDGFTAVNFPGATLSSLVFPVNPVSGIGISANGSGGVDWYHNGVFSSNSAGTVPVPDLWAKQPLNFFNHSDSSTGETGTGGIGLLVIFNRALGRSEHKDLWRDPFALLDFGRPPAFYASAGAAPGAINRRLRTLMGVGR